MDKDYRSSDWGDDELDRELSAALASYAGAEPRSGLENRVLANLRTERLRLANRSWWCWGVVAVFVAAIVVAVGLAWRTGKPSVPAATSHSLPTKQDPQPAWSAANEPINGKVRPQPLPAPRKRTAPRPQPAVVVAEAEPKLDQFPSPEPLSEQEKILASYVAEYPERAVLVARAQAEMLRQDEEEEMQKSGSGNDKDKDSQRRNQ
jgi:hypothetical protein